jgi:hypothetical protein
MCWWLFLRILGCFRVTGNPEVIGSAVGLVPTNALVLLNVRMVGYTSKRPDGNNERAKRFARSLLSHLGVQANLTHCDLNGPRPFLADNRDLDQVLSGREGDVRGRIP